MKSFFNFEPLSNYQQKVYDPFTRAKSYPFLAVIFAGLIAMVAALSVIFAGYLIVSDKHKSQLTNKKKGKVFIGTVIRIAISALLVDYWFNNRYFVQFALTSGTLLILHVLVLFK